MKFLVVLALALGCGSSEMVMPGEGGDDGGTDAGELESDARALEPDTGPMVDASASPDRMADRGADTQAPDAGPPAAPACLSFSRVAPCARPGGFNMCGGYLSIPRWKDGRECANCNSGDVVRTGCTVLGNPDECTGQDRPPLICVASCDECQER